MRRTLSILLFAATLLPLLAPLLTIAAGAQSNVPACCRRDGKHHCMMGNVEALLGNSGHPRLIAPIEKCPYQQRALSAVHHDTLSSIALASGSLLLVQSQSASEQAECLRRISFDRSRQKRGPPLSSAKSRDAL
jgi:hypothetical protein